MHEINDQPVPKKQWDPPDWVMPALAVCLAIGLVWSVFGLTGEKRRAADLSAENKTLATNLTEVQTQMRIVTERLNAMSTAARAQRDKDMESVKQAEAETSATLPPVAAVEKPRTVAMRRPAGKPAPPKDPRVDQLQLRLNEQEREISLTKQQLNNTRDELQGSLNSTKDELNGTISRTQDSLSRTQDTVAKNHDEVVELQRRGQRNYYEFTLDKDKGFHRVGPISLSLRKANTKRKSYDLEMMVDDQKLQKKNVNLFEPVVISTPDRGFPMQLVVNEVTKDVVKGYVSEPKFRVPQLAATTGATPSNEVAFQPRTR